MVDRARLQEMNKDQLVGAVERAVDRAKEYKDKAVVAATEMMDWLFAGVGGGAVGWWLGSIARKIEDGEEGYDEDSLKFFGVDKDLVAGIGVGILSQIKGIKKYKAPVKAASVGALSFWAGRKMYQVAYEKEEDDA